MPLSREEPLRRPATVSREVDPLALRLIAGDEHVLVELLERARAPLECWLAKNYRRLRPFEREDVVQDAFARLWEGRSGIDPTRGSLMSYLRRIARNAALNRLKTAWHRQRQAEISCDPTTMASVVEDRSGRGRRRTGTPRLTEDLRRVLAQLSELQRQIVWADACAPEGVVSTRELAADLGISQHRVRTERHRGRSKLRRLLEQETSGMSTSPRTG